MNKKISESKLFLNKILKKKNIKLKMHVGVAIQIQY